MKTKAICSFFVLFAIAAVLVSSTPAAFADHSEVTIVTVEGSGFGQDCAVANGGSGCYTPVEATVDVGGKVIMSNSDPTGAIHSFTSGTIDGFSQNPDGNFDSGFMDANTSYEWVPETVGDYPYYCALHVWMIGSITVQEAEAEKPMDDAQEEKAMHSDEELMVEIKTGTAGKGERLSIDVNLKTMSGDSVEHVNYNVKATQNGKVVLDDTVHDHDGVMNHMTSPLPAATSDETPVDVKVTFNGYGIPGQGDFTGPIGQVAEKQVVPEFGTVAMMVLAVAIISIVAVTAKSRVVPRF